MKKSLKTGISFGLTSGTITTLGLMIGLNSGTNSRGIVIGGILTIAIADSLSDALGIHISEEADHTRTNLQIWIATMATFLSKLYAVTFIIPILIFDLPVAININLIWGVFLLTILSYYLAKSQGAKPWKVILEHLIIIAIVITLTHLLGTFISKYISN
jgi:VIT1/CCC1 family predicted Fe2+/Mn2+ transporter|tara:strand:+ start:162 stop:638 length:477 start_codon:yes stop_codon:yes gene_type:complete